MPKSTKNIRIRDQEPKSNPKGGRRPPFYVQGTGGASAQRVRPGNPVR